MRVDLHQARSAIASEIGPDIGNFTPPDEKRFFGAELMLMVGGAFLYAFLKGFAKKIGEEAGEKTGEALWNYMANKIEEGRKSDKETQDRLLDESADEAIVAIRRSGVDVSQAQDLAELVETELTLVFSEEAPEDVSKRIAHRVRVVALEAVSSK